MDFDDASILASGRSIIDEELRALEGARDRLNASFVTLVRRLLALRGKIGVTGVGKSGIIGEKIAMTLSSTGTPALFLKPVDALHGDLGVLRSEDYLIAISNSGETTEVLAVVEAARAIEVPVAALTGKLTSSLATAADVAIDIGVDREACPLGLAPTASTTVTLAVGDALAMALLQARGFTREHYARFHPGGALGQRLRHRVADLMREGDRVPTIASDRSFAEAIVVMTETDNLGVVLVVNARGELEGILTDGDLRRQVLGARDSGGVALERRVTEVMTGRPKAVEPDTPASEALRIMEVHGITSLAVVDPSSRPVGILHLHDILGRGKILL